MRKTISVLIILVTSICFGQNFEGKIIYSISIISKVPGVENKQLTSLMGTTQEYIIKEGNYKSITNGKLLQWQLYTNKDNNIYSKVSSSETVYCNDAKINEDEVISAELKKNALIILGYNCDELTLKCNKQIQKYYFNSGIVANPKLFENHKFGNWYEYLAKTNALPLKIITETFGMIIENTATEVIPLKIDDELFELPKDTKILKK